MTRLWWSTTLAFVLELWRRSSWREIKIDVVCLCIILLKTKLVLFKQINVWVVLQWNQYQHSQWILHNVLIFIKKSINKHTLQFILCERRNVLLRSIQALVQVLCIEQIDVLEDLFEHKENSIKNACIVRGDVHNQCSILKKMLMESKQEVFLFQIERRDREKYSQKLGRRESQSLGDILVINIQNDTLIEERVRKMVHEFIGIMNENSCWT